MPHISGVEHLGERTEPVYGAQGFPVTPSGPQKDDAPYVSRLIGAPGYRQYSRYRADLALLQCAPLCSYAENRECWNPMPAAQMNGRRGQTPMAPLRLRVEVQLGLR